MAGETIPIAAGKAAAASAYLAQGGERVSRGNRRLSGFRYTQGPIKGMTEEQAQQDFENKWTNASPEVKDKYAKREQPLNQLAPTELQQALAAQARSQPQPVKPNGTKPNSSNPSITNPTNGQPRLAPLPNPIDPTAPASIQHVGKSSGQFRNRTPQPNPVAQTDPGPLSNDAILADGAKRMNAAGLGVGNDNLGLADNATPDSGTRSTDSPTPAGQSQTAASATAASSKYTPSTDSLSPIKTTAPTKQVYVSGAFGAPMALPPSFTEPDPSYLPEKEKATKDAQAAVAQRAQKLKDDEVDFTKKQNVERVKLGLPTKSLDPNSSTRSQNIADTTGPDGKVDLGKLSTDDRMYVQGKTNAGGTPVDKAPLEPTTPSSSSPVTGTATTSGKAVTSDPKNLADRKPKLTPDEISKGYTLATPGATAPKGMELIGNRSGAPLYAPTGQVYGKDLQPPTPATSSTDANGNVTTTPGNTAVTLDSLRANYENSFNKPQKFAQSFVQGPASQTEPGVKAGPGVTQAQATATGRADGYQSPSLQQDWAREDQDASDRQAVVDTTAKDGYAAGSILEKNQFINRTNKVKALQGQPLTPNLVPDAASLSGNSAVPGDPDAGKVLSTDDQNAVNGGINSLTPGNALTASANAGTTPTPAPTPTPDDSTDDDTEDDGTSPTKPKKTKNAPVAA